MFASLVIYFSLHIEFADPNTSLRTRLRLIPTDERRSYEQDLLMKLMYTLGKSSFNLYIGCMSQWKFFESFSLPATIPEFTSQLVLSRTCNVSVSWEKIMLKLEEALTEEALLHAMLACRMLILVEAKDKSSVLRVMENGRQLLSDVLPCRFGSSKAWPESSMCFYVIFGWMKRKQMFQQAMEEFIERNR